MSRFDLSRRAGLSVPLFALRSERDWGVGEVPDLSQLIAFAAAAGFRLVQLLPFHEVWSGETSPYSAVTAFALDPIYLAYRDQEDFCAAGGLGAPGLPKGTEERIEVLRAAPGVCHDEVRAVKEAAARVAFNHFETHEFATRSQRARAFEQFMQEEESWLSDYALYWALARIYGPDWTRWPDGLARRTPLACAQARTAHARAIRFRAYLEWQLSLQWQAVQRTARSVGVILGGDLPFVVSRHSADVWRHPELFCTGLRLGVPPDAFSDQGQDWGLPVYDFRRMVRTRFSWLRSRAVRAGALCRLWRVDHVLGFYRSYYRRDDGGPPGHTPASVSQQKWLGPRALDALSAAGEIVGEDLGPVPDWVRASLTAQGIPGYRVMRWEKDGETFRDPRAYPPLSVATTGTHDTETLAVWYDALSEREKQSLYALPGLKGCVLASRFDATTRDALLRLVYDSGSALAILPFGDLWGDRRRINVPGSVNAYNWTYRIPRTLAALSADESDKARFLRLARDSGRT